MKPKPKRPVSKRPKQKSPLLVDVLAEDRTFGGQRTPRERNKTPMSDEALDHFVELYQAHLASIVAELKSVGCLPGLFALYAAVTSAESVVYDQIARLAASPEHADKLCLEAIDTADQYGGSTIIASQVLEQPEGVA